MGRVSGFCFRYHLYPCLAANSRRFLAKADGIVIRCRWLGELSLFDRVGCLLEGTTLLI